MMMASLRSPSASSLALPSAVLGVTLAAAPAEAVRRGVSSAVAR